MRVGLKRFGLCTVLALVGGALLPAPGAAAATTYEVSIGRFLEGAPAESMRFFPSWIQVHPGDTLHFTTESFHTATLLPSGESPTEWAEAYARLGTDDPWALARPDPDDGPTSFKFGNRAIFPSDATCGAPDQPACSFNGSGDPVNGVLNSGVPFLGPVDFSVTITASPGTTIWALCLVHPNMRMKIEVVGAGDVASTQKKIDRATAAQMAQDSDAAASLDARFSERQSKHETAGGKVVWDAWAGVDNRHVSLFAMYPRTLHVGTGDTVEWHFDSLVFEDHTVTFPVDRGREIANDIQPQCDPDGDTGPGPDNPPDLEEPPFCTDPTQLEFDFSDQFVPPLGNGVVRSATDLESSGVRGSNAPSDGSYELTFGADSSDRGFGYLCLIHPFMRGRVVVA